MRFYLTLFLLFIAFVLPAAPEKAPVKPGFDQEALDAYKSERAFNYGMEPKSDPGILDWLLGKFLEFIESFFSDKGASPYLRWLFVITVSGLVIVLLYRQQFRIPLQSNTDESINFEEITNDIYAHDLQKLLDEAIQKEAYRDAVRLIYLLFLRNLSDAQIIRWKLDKTNRQYTREIENLPLRERFEMLTELYEYIWYGQFEIDGNQFQTIRVDFMSVINEQIPKKKQNGLR